MANAPRERIVRAFAELPEEAFLYVCGLLWNVARTSGGFRPDSRAGLVALGELAKRHCTVAGDRPAQE